MALTKYIYPPSGWFKPAASLTSASISDFVAAAQAAVATLLTGKVDKSSLSASAVGSSVAQRDAAGALTASVATASTHLATKGQVDSTFASVPVTAVTAAYTLASADAGRAVEVTSASAVSITVPPNSANAIPVNTIIEVVQLGAGTVTLVAGSGVTLQTSSTLVARAQYSSLVLRKRGTDTWLVYGDMK